MAGVFKDAVFGTALGFLARVLFAAVEMAGYFIDTQMGFGFMNILNPFSEQQASLLSAFQYQLAITVFLLANGHLILLESLVKSFQVVPPGAIALHGAFGMALVPMLQTMFMLGLQMALPATAVLLLVDVAFGLVARMVPQMNIFMVGMPAKVIVGLMTVAMLLPVMSLVVGHILTGTVLGLNVLMAAAK
jgi:flagellar biosynthetic protein FliR